MKSTIPFGKLPVLMIDGKPLPQSYAIARYVAKEAGLVPEDNLLSGYCDAVVDTMSDIGMELYKLHMLADEAERKKQYAELNQKTLAPALSYINKKLEEKEWIVSGKITWADLALAVVLGGIAQKKEDFLKPYPKLASHVQKVRSLPKIQEWIEKSPKTEM